MSQVFFLYFYNFSYLINISYFHCFINNIYFLSVLFFLSFFLHFFIILSFSFFSYLILLRFLIHQLLTVLQLLFRFRLSFVLTLFFLSSFLPLPHFPTPLLFLPPANTTTNVVKLSPSHLLVRSLFFILILLLSISFHFICSSLTSFFPSSISHFHPFLVTPLLCPQNHL